MPIITNETFHTIGENFLVVMLTPIEQPELEGATVNIYPNPFEQYTTLEVEGLPLGDLELEIFNSAGQLVQRLTQAQIQQIQLHRGDLASGLYFFHLNHNQQHLQDGKLIIQ